MGWNLLPLILHGAKNASLVSINRRLELRFVCFVLLAPTALQSRRLVLVFVCSAPKELTRSPQAPPCANSVIRGHTARLLLPLAQALARHVLRASILKPLAQHLLLLATPALLAPIRELSAQHSYLSVFCVPRDSIQGPLQPPAAPHARPVVPGISQLQWAQPPSPRARSAAKGISRLQAARARVLRVLSATSALLSAQLPALLVLLELTIRTLHPALAYRVL